MMKTVIDTNTNVSPLGESGSFCLRKCLYSHSLSCDLVGKSFLLDFWYSLETSRQVFLDTTEYEKLRGITRRRVKSNWRFLHPKNNTSDLCPSTFLGRIMIMSMFHDVEWDKVECDKETLKWFA